MPTLRWIPLVSMQEQGTYLRLRREMPGTAKTEAPDVPMETEAPESSPQEEASGVKVEPAEDSPQVEESETKDEHMGATGDVNDEAMGANAR